ncbi:hypothetical protein D3C80_1556910 [compost metagenome]
MYPFSAHYEKRDRTDRNTTAATSSERKHFDSASAAVYTRGIIFHPEVTAACCKSKRHFTDRQNDTAIRCFYRISDNRIDVHHTLDIFHRRLHQTLDRMVTHIVILL